MSHNQKLILLISPAYHWWWSVPHLGLGYIASSLERIGLQPKIIDCQVAANYKKQIIESLKPYSVVGISANIGTISSALETSNLIRQHSPSTRIIFGGPHSTAIYDKLIPRYADIVVLGEGEDTIAELMQEEDLSKIKGIAYWDGSLKVNPRRQFIEDLDRLGFPSWHLYDLKRYNFTLGCLPYGTIITSRGCPYRCIYCNNFVSHGTKLRLRSIENVLAEIDYLVNNLKVKEVQIWDDNFTFYPERTKQFCRKIIEKEYRNLIFSIPNGIRADIGDLDMFKLMERAGFYWTGVGVDSSSPEVLNKLHRNLNLEKVNETLSMINKTRIKVKLHFMIGFPFDTIETMRQTINLAKRLLVQNRSVFAAFFCMAIPFPGTDFYQLVKGKGKFLYDLVFNSISYNERAVYEINGLKSHDVDKMFTKANREIAILPSFIWRNLKLRHRSLRMIPSTIKYLWDKFLHGGKIR
ncbi:MAG: radical SAM protein [Candidatus Omnitrophota bacterium]|jgi:radical SAM superfamily enzyme YgiQ (UPF0313 family)